MGTPRARRIVAAIVLETLVIAAAAALAIVTWGDASSYGTNGHTAERYDAFVESYQEKSTMTMCGKTPCTDYSYPTVLDIIDSSGHVVDQVTFTYSTEPSDLKSVWLIDDTYWEPTNTVANRQFLGRVAAALGAFMIVVLGSLGVVKLTAPLGRDTSPGGDSPDLNKPAAAS